MLGCHPFHQGIEISPLNRFERYRYVGEVLDQRFLFRRKRPQRRARTWRASPSFAVVHPSSPIDGTKRTSAISSLRYSFSETRASGWAKTRAVTPLDNAKNQRSSGHLSVRRVKQDVDPRPNLPIESSWVYEFQT
jgi:hypothetical protein